MLAKLPAAFGTVPRLQLHVLGSYLGGTSNIIGGIVFSVKLHQIRVAGLPESHSACALLLLPQFHPSLRMNIKGTYY